MTRLFLILAFACLVGVAGKKQKDPASAEPKAPPPADCKAESAQADKLVKEKSALSSELEAAKEQLKKAEAEAAKPCDAPEFSITSLLSKTGGIALSVRDHLLQQTTVDEQIMTSLSSMKVHAEGIKGQITSIDYNGYMNNLKTHPVYLTHVAPHMTTAADALAPHMAHLDPVYKIGKEQYATAAAALEKNVLPKIREFSVGRKTFQDGTSLLNNKLGDLLAPVFKTVSDAAPDHTSFLPKQPVDRFLFLLFVIISLYIFTKIAVKLFFFTAKIALKLLWVPFKVLKLALSLFFCCATGFYCCGLCRAKKASKTKKGEAKASNSAAKATEAEVISLLEESKKTGKLEAGAKTLAEVVKSGKPFKKPKNMEGKLLTKEVLVKALSYTKFKEVNVKALSL